MSMAAQAASSPVTVKLAWCKGCGICYALCPTQTLAADDLGKAIVVAPEKCTRCRICENHCPDFAIIVEGGKKS